MTSPERLAVGYEGASQATTLSEPELRRLVKAGLIPHTRVGRRVLFPIDALRRWLEDGAS